MKNLEILGLEPAKVGNVVKGLNQLLADFQIYYMNLRGLHWNVKGKGFFTLHEKYEELYNDAANKVDEIAERILQLDAIPENRFSEYLKVASIKQDGFQQKGSEGIDIVLGTLKNLIQQERNLIKTAEEANDEVTVAIMDEYLQQQEKTVWMLVSFLSEHK
jgi:hypothetical protein